MGPSRRPRSSLCRGQGRAWRWPLVGLLCLGASRPGGGAEQPGRTPCVYFGTGSTTRGGDRIVKSTCPPPLNKGVYYFKLDLDPGGASEALQDAALVSPADAVCEAGTCSAAVGPGYDLYIAKGCLPVPEAPGLAGKANTGGATRKPLELSSGSFARFYVAAVRRADTDYGSPGCSFTIYPGFLGAGQAQRCSIVDYMPNATITTSTVTTTVTVTTFNTTATNRTLTPKSVVLNRTATSSTVVSQSTTARPGESIGSDTLTCPGTPASGCCLCPDGSFDGARAVPPGGGSCQTILHVQNACGWTDRGAINRAKKQCCVGAKKPAAGALITTTVTTVQTSTVLSEVPEDIDFCKPQSKPIPPEYIFATLVVSCLGAAICFWFYLRWERRRAARRLCVEREERFRQELDERSISQSHAIESNSFQISEALQAREERNWSIRSQRLGTGAVLVCACVCVRACVRARAYFLFTPLSLPTHRARRAGTAVCTSWRSVADSGNL